MTTSKMSCGSVSRRREVAHGVLCSLLKPEDFLLPIYGEEGSRLFVVCFLQTSQRYTFDSNVQSTHGQLPLLGQGQRVWMIASKITFRSMVYRARGCRVSYVLFSNAIYGRLFSIPERPNIVPFWGSYSEPRGNSSQGESLPR